MRYRILALLSLAELLGMSLWFAGSAVAGALGTRWGMSPTDTAWVTGVVQLGFVAGTAVAALLNLADLIPARLYFGVSALAAGLANAGVAAAGGSVGGLAGRFLTGFFLAGVYPPAMKMIATWFRNGRGLAIGTIVGALTVGKATPYLVRAIPHATANGVLLAASLAALSAGLLVLAGYRDGPDPFPRRPFSWGLVGVVARHRETRLAIEGYLGHMWELYAVWTWAPAFLAASAVAAGTAAGHEAATVSVLSFLTIAAGGAGCVWGGWAAGRWGYARTVNLSMLVSGGISLLIGLLFGAPLWMVGTVAVVWGFFVVADSAQFSAMVTEVAPPHAVGTALTLQTSIGFLLTTATIELVPHLARSTGWRWAFPVLALGPAAGIAAIRRMASRSPAPSRSASAAGSDR